MARVVEDPGFAWSHDMYKYPWSTWLDGQLWELTPGVDFKIPLKNFQSMCHKYAGNYDMRVRTKISGGKFYLKLRQDDD